MTRPLTALCAAISIEDAGDAPPDWLHLLPAGEVRTEDGRGPYRAADLVALAAASLPAGGKLVLDENHATDLAAPKGGSAPARGWIVELQARGDGLWGRVAWTADAVRRVIWKEYRGVSPVIAHKKDGAITGILRASLTNTPNLQGLVALHQENSMNLHDALVEAMGLDSGADDAAIVSAVKDKIAGADGAAVALQSALAPIAKAAGVAQDADAATVLAGVQQLASGGDSEQTIRALQSEIATLGKSLQSVTETAARKDATAFVDGAIAAGRAGVKPMRERYITMHMADAKGTEELINAMPSLTGATITGGVPGDAKPGDLSAADKSVIALMGLDPEDYKKTLAANGQGVEAL